MWGKHTQNQAASGAQAGGASWLAAHLGRQLLLGLLELALQLQQRAVLELRRAVEVVVALGRLRGSRPLRP